MPRGGRLTIEGQNITLDNSLSDGGDIAPGDYVMLAISDTGTGIPRELLDRVLEPFFTTKPVGKGSGLGLSMVYGFVKQSGGHVKIYSELNHGTTIKLLLPRTSSRGEAVETGAPQQDMPRSTRGETILLVEDDANIRKLVQRILNTLGYQTQAAEDGPSALATLAEIPHLDLLFSDVVLPGGMSGVELAEQAKRRHTGLKVLLMSGYTRNALKEVSENDEIHLISKPFRKEDLARVIYSLLNEAAEKKQA
jgi:CheY-like chemotaxis protein